MEASGKCQEEFDDIIEQFENSSQSSKKSFRKYEMNMTRTEKIKEPGKEETLGKPQSKSAQVHSSPGDEYYEFISNSEPENEQSEIYEKEQFRKEMETLEKRK
ncbi:hypothetical protein JTB14_024505 [Gonioctena quinquepunctata]|nr:hypothetical protein JTB14_024505 [Gonioctena quinquepunctata]